MRPPLLSIAAALFLASVPLKLVAQGTAPVTSAQVLTREHASGILPPSVFFRGQTANIQGRNSAGIQLPDGKLALFALVDSSGYSSALQQTYQAYLLTEVPLTLGDKVLGPGAYGFGFIEGERMVVMDLGGNDILHAATTVDGALLRPNPLQIVADATTPNRFRLYLGRRFVVVTPAAK